MKISARQSPLAQIQAFHVGDALQKHSSTPMEYLFRQSLGDQNLNEPLWKMPEKGVFTEDFYQDLVADKTDMVVHSWKDLPTEAKEHTVIAATMPREDQRDLLLFKPSSHGKADVRLFSSSPRRTFNLKDFLPQVLPWKTQSVEFHSVRGNISTRVQKLLDDPKIDGLIVAKAAIDRLLTDQKFHETRKSLRQALDGLQWMVLPLSENPNAAAQGALAIEINKSRQDVKDLLTKVNCVDSYNSAQRERDILKEFGGGCHLALGMSVLERPYGRLEIVKGLTPGGKSLHQKKFIPKKARPQGMTVARLEFESLRSDLDHSLPADADAYFISRAEAWLPGSSTQKILWAAGLQTWKKLAAQGVWIQGSAEGLGESENPRLDAIAGKSLNWVSLSHESDAPKRVATYKLDLSLLSQTLPSADAFVWKSASEFQLALKRFPVLREKAHICGPGRTFQKIKTELKTDQNLFVELSDEFVTVI